MRGVREVPGILHSSNISLPHSLSRSLVLRVHEPSHEASSIAVPAQHLALPPTQPARGARLEAAVEVIFRVQASSLTLRARHGAVAVTVLAQNARPLGRRRSSWGTRTPCRSIRTRRIRPHGGGTSATERDLARAVLLFLLLHAGVRDSEAQKRSQLTGL